MLILLAGSLEPNALGYTFVVGQAVVVAAFAQSQYLDLRKVVA